jgi:hypothetical protein
MKKFYQSRLFDERAFGHNVERKLGDMRSFGDHVAREEVLKEVSSGPVVRKAGDEKRWPSMWLGDEVIRRIFIEHDRKGSGKTEIVEYMKGDGKKKQKKRGDRKSFSNHIDKNMGDEKVFSNHMVRTGGAEMCVKRLRRR